MHVSGTLLQLAPLCQRPFSIQDRILLECGWNYTDSSNIFKGTLSPNSRLFFHITHQLELFHCTKCNSVFPPELLFFLSFTFSQSTLALHPGSRLSHLVYLSVSVSLSFSWALVLCWEIEPVVRRGSQSFLYRQLFSVSGVSTLWLCWSSFHL